MRSTVKYFYVRFLQQIKLKAKLTGNENNARTVSGCFRDVVSHVVSHVVSRPAALVAGRPFFWIASSVNPHWVTNWPCRGQASLAFGLHWLTSGQCRRWLKCGRDRHFTPLVAFDFLAVNCDTVRNLSMMIASSGTAYLSLTDPQCWNLLPTTFKHYNLTTTTTLIILRCLCNNLMIKVAKMEASCL